MTEENLVLKYFRERKETLDRIESRIKAAVEARKPGWDRTVLDAAVQLYVGSGTEAFSNYLLTEIARRRHSLDVQLFDLED